MPLIIVVTEARRTGNSIHDLPLVLKHSLNAIWRILCVCLKHIGDQYILVEGITCAAAQLAHSRIKSAKEGQIVHVVVWALSRLGTELDARSKLFANVVETFHDVLADS